MAYLRKQQLHFFDCFPGRFGIREPGLGGGAEAEDAEDYWKGGISGCCGRWGVGEGGGSLKSFHVMFWNAGGMKKPMAKLKSQFAMDARAMPVARVSRDHTSAA
jgi:hypothetical protein